MAQPRLLSREDHAIVINFLPAQHCIDARAVCREWRQHVKAHICNVPALEALLRDMQKREHSPYFCSPGPEEDDAVRRFAERHFGWEGHKPFVPVAPLTGQVLRDFVHISGRREVVASHSVDMETLCSSQDVAKHINDLAEFRHHCAPSADVGMWNALYLILTSLAEDFAFTTVHVEHSVGRLGHVHIALFWEEHQRMRKISGGLEAAERNLKRLSGCPVRHGVGNPGICKVATPSQTIMLHIRMMSGEKVASIPVEEVEDVMTLKQELSRRHGLPPRFRQQLVLQGHAMEDAAKLDSPVDLDLELVLLPWTLESGARSDEMVNAAWNSQTSEVEALLLQRQHPDVVDRDGKTPLRMAASHCHMEVLHLLLEAAADIDFQSRAASNFRQTALMNASSRGDTEVLRVLLEAGADKNLTDDYGNTALTSARSIEVVCLLLDAGVDLNLANKRGETAVMIAAQTDRLDLLSLLLAAQADVNLANKRGSTALMLASELGFGEVVHELLKAGSDANFAGKHGFNPLMTASREAHVEVVRLLLDAGAGMNSTTKDGVTALMLAAGKGHTEVLRLLLEAGAEPGLGSRQGNTALMLASQNGHVEVVRVLLEAGADRNSANRDGLSPLLLSIENGHDDVQRILEDCCESLDFSCGEAKNQDSIFDWIFGTPDLEFYRKAAAMASAKYGVKLAEDPIFVTWVCGPQLVATGSELLAAVFFHGVAALRHGKCTWRGMTARPDDDDDDDDDDDVDADVGDGDDGDGDDGDDVLASFSVAKGLKFVQFVERAEAIKKESEASKPGPASAGQWAARLELRSVGYVPFFEKAGVVHLCPERLESIVSTWCYPVGMRQVAKDVHAAGAGCLLSGRVNMDARPYKNPAFGKRRRAIVELDETAVRRCPGSRTAAFRNMPNILAPSTGEIQKQLAAGLKDDGCGGWAVVLAGLGGAGPGGLTAGRQAGQVAPPIGEAHGSHHGTDEGPSGLLGQESSILGGMRYLA
ncbi:Ankyrin-2 [Symbiodinium microadriaticum]|uniref:Ankyrin-2 n=1 Tax=Symbiodinium microadriaticum TaxID=2951 RepID=A0A1Q9DRX4_SYMMI|nr:Ankyrin-2 [Symbiodinium microadriaticum]